VGGGNAVLAGVAAGQDLPTVALCAPQNGFQLVLSRPAVDKLAATGVTATSPVADRVAALKGLILATTGPGNAIDAVVRATLHEHGIAPTRT
jgi:ABC-type nitrate/sulfonate/bicarbonate transport system substrate-binding protein